MKTSCDGVAHVFVDLLLSGLKRAIDAFYLFHKNKTVPSCQTCNSDNLYKEL